MIMTGQDEKNAMMQGEIDNLNQKVAFLEQKLKDLQQNRVIPRNPWDVVGPGLYDQKKRCQKCGISLEGPIGYSCPDRECPTFCVVTC